MAKSFKKSLLTNFFQSKITTIITGEIAVGLILIFATICALLISNSSNFTIYQDFFNQNLDLDIKFLALYKKLTLRDWINDALMAVFFFLVGLELKTEILIGELSSRKKIALPLICACGGVLVPMLIFLYFNHNIVENIKGFAVPCATDIAFAFGFITLFGKTFSPSAKIFLVALAIIDDLIAILIIAFFYTDNLKFFYIFGALLVCALLFVVNRRKSDNLILYLVLGFLLWLMVLQSGIHATLAGVIFAFFIPLKVKQKNFLSNIAHKISPIVNFLILPIFAFANGGVRINDISIDDFTSPLVLGIAFGLFFGKQIGVILSAYLSLKLGLAKLPRGTNWLEFYGVSLFTGIGFTMALFIASLAFNDNLKNFNEAKIGVLLGTILSIIAGGLVAVILQKKR